MAPRARVLSFISQWGGGVPRSPTNATPTEEAVTSPITPQKQPFSAVTPSQSNPNYDSSLTNSPTATSPAHRRTRSQTLDELLERPSSRPLSMVQTYNPPMMDTARDTLPELLPIFTHLNSHSNKLYQEGYFLMLPDLDTQGRPSRNREWNEVFAQLVGTVVSFWDAQALDAAGADGEVVPTFINLADASIKMIPSLPMSGSGAPGETLQNVLSVSTAANNRFLFHFNSLNSLTQWTAGIRLSMFEHTTLQEAYTGSLIAGKGKALNNIRDIMERTRMRHDDWARVRFGAGTPWRRCWCVVTPPDEKEYAKMQKQMKKRSPYDRSQPTLKGDVKFYDTKKITKKTRPIATITDAYSAYAIYPQSKPLIDQSTLVKIEGKITIHSKPESSTEGFVFIMPEVHPAVSGFEMMLRFLFPVFDTFALYGRPNRLVAEPLDTRSLMFAMPSQKRYGYLELWDVANLIRADGSNDWSERRWRKELKDETAKRLTDGPTRENSMASSRRNTVSRISLPPTRNGVRFGDEPNQPYSQPSTRQSSPSRDDPFGGPRRTDSAPPVGGIGVPRHQRSISEQQHNYNNRFQAADSGHLARIESRGQGQYDSPPASPIRHSRQNGSQTSLPTYDGGYESEDGRGTHDTKIPPELTAATQPMPLPTQIAAPPPFVHKANQKPPVQPQQAADSRRANSGVDPATLQQLADANAKIPQGFAAAGAAAAFRYGQEQNQQGRRSGENDRNRLNPGQQTRLPTIPASPYIEQNDPTIAHMAQYQQQPEIPPPVPEHGVPEYQQHPQYQPQQQQQALGISATAATADLSRNSSYGPPDLSRSSSYGPSENLSRGNSYEGQPMGLSRGISRKPVPGRSSLSAEIISPPSPSHSSLNSLRAEVVDPEMLDRLLGTQAGPATSQAAATTAPPPDRAPSLSSNYDDDKSVASSDYASTISSREKPKAAARDYNRPRAGVMKTVGDTTAAPLKGNEKHPVMDAELQYRNLENEADIDVNIPDVEFGPTYRLDLEKKQQRPGTSGTLTQATHNDRSRSRSRDRLAQVTGSNSPKQQDSRKSSYFTGRSGSKSPGILDVEQNNRRSMMWQPGMAAEKASGHAAKNSLSAEDWVQQRAAQASQPLAAPPRATPSPSHNRTDGTPPQALSRTTSGEWSQLLQGYERTPPAERVPSRPHSRGASIMLNQQGLINNESTKLSAREQEFVARATGTPLLSVEKKKPIQERPKSAGLIGAIEAREKEKRAILARGAAGTTAQNAVFQRQQQQAQQHAQHMRQSSFGSTNLQMQQMGMPSPQLPFATPQQSYSLPGSPSIYGTPGPTPSPFQMRPHSPGPGYVGNVNAAQQGYAQTVVGGGYAGSSYGGYSPQPQPQQHGHGQFMGGGPQTYAQQQAVLVQANVLPQQVYGASWDALQRQQQGQRGWAQGRR